MTAAIRDNKGKGSRIELNHNDNKKKRKRHTTNRYTNPKNGNTTKRSRDALLVPLPGSGDHSQEQQEFLISSLFFYILEQASRRQQREEQQHQQRQLLDGLEAEATVGNWHIPSQAPVIRNENDNGDDGDNVSPSNHSIKSNNGTAVSSSSVSPPSSSAVVAGTQIDNKSRRSSSTTATTTIAGGTASTTNTAVAQSTEQSQPFRRSDIIKNNDIDATDASNYIVESDDDMSSDTDSDVESSSSSNEHDDENDDGDNDEQKDIGDNDNIDRGKHEKGENVKIKSENETGIENANLVMSPSSSSLEQRANRALRILKRRRQRRQRFANRILLRKQGKMSTSNDGDSADDDDDDDDGGDDNDTRYYDHSHHHALTTPMQRRKARQQNPMIQTRVNRRIYGTIHDIELFSMLPPQPEPTESERRLQELGMSIPHHYGDLLVNTEYTWLFVLRKAPRMYSRLMQNTETGTFLFCDKMDIELKIKNQNTYPIRVMLAVYNESEIKFGQLGYEAPQPRPSKKQRKMKEEESEAEAEAEEEEPEEVPFKGLVKSIYPRESFTLSNLDNDFIRITPGKTEIVSILASQLGLNLKQGEITQVMMILLREDEDDTVRSVAEKIQSLHFPLDMSRKYVMCNEYASVTNFVFEKFTKMKRGE